MKKSTYFLSDKNDGHWSPVLSSYLLRNIRGISRRVQFRRFIFNSSLRIMESSRNTQETVWCAAGRDRELYSLPGESLDVRFLFSTEWEFACSLALSSENRQIALVRNGDTNGWLLEGLQTTSSMLGHRTRYAGSIREDPSRKGIWCLEYIPSIGSPETPSKEKLFESKRGGVYPDYLPSKIFEEAQASLIYVSYSGDIYRTQFKGVVTDLALQREDSILSFGLCQTLQELSRYLTNGECPYLSVSTFEVDLKYERTAPFRQVKSCSVQGELTSILAKGKDTACSTRSGPSRGRHGGWAISLPNGIEPVIPLDGSNSQSPAHEPLEKIESRYLVQRGNAACAVTTRSPDTHTEKIPLVWFDVLHKAGISEVTDFYFCQLTGNFAARPSSAEQIHGSDRLVIRVFVDLQKVISEGVRTIHADVFEVVKTLRERQARGATLSPSNDMFIGGSSFGAALAVSFLSLCMGGVRASVVRSGCYHRGLIAGGIEGRLIDRPEKGSVYEELSIPWDNNSLRDFPPMLVAHGENDEYYSTSFSQAQGFVERLHEANVSAWLLGLSGEGHALRSVEGIEKLSHYERSWLYFHAENKDAY